MGQGTNPKTYSDLRFPALQPTASRLGEDGLAELRRRYEARLAAQRGPDGSYLIPLANRLLWEQV